MVDKTTQVKNSLFYLLPVIIGNAIPILTLPIFTRILTKEDYGVWGLAQVYAIFLSGISNFGLTIGYERNFFEKRGAGWSSGLLYTTLLFVFLTFSAGVLITYACREWLSQMIIGSSRHSDVLFWAYCATGVMGLKTYYMIYFKNSENAKSYVIYTIDESLLQLFFSFFLVVYLRVGILGIIWSQFLAGSIIFIVLSVKFSRFLPVSIDIDALKESLKLSIPLTPRIFFGVIGNQFDKYMIGILNTVGGVGIYNIGQKISYVVFTYMTAIQNVFAPQVYKRMFELKENGGKSIGKYLTPFLYFSIAVALLVSLFSEEIIIVLTPESYHGAIDITIVLSMLFGTYFFGKQPQLIYTKKTYLTSILTAVNIGLNILIDIPFVYRWGAVGAAWGGLLASTISGTISFYFSQRSYKIEWEYRKVISIYVIFFGSAIAILLLRNMAVSYEIRILIKLMSIAGYIFLGIKARILRKEDYYLLKSKIILIKGFR